MKNIIILVCSLFIVLSCEELEIDIQKLEPTDFTVVVNTTNESIAVNETTELNLLINIEEPRTENLNFSLTYFDAGINGIFSINGVSYNEGETISNIPLGNTVISFKGIEIGSGNLTFQITASNGTIKNIDIPLSIQKTNFDFEILFDKSENYINELTNFSIDITKNGDENLTYQAYFKNVEGTIQIGEFVISQNTKFDVLEGVTFGEFKGTQVRKSEIEFIVEASNGIIKTKKLEFDVIQTNFEVIITPNPLEAPYTRDIDFTILVRPPAGLVQEIEYFMYFTSTDLGSLFIKFSGNDSILSQGFEYNLSNNLTSLLSNSGLLRQQGVVSPRTGNLTFNFRDSNGATYETTLDVDFFEN